MKGDGGKAFRETHEVTSKYVDRVRETRRLQRIADGYPAERFTPSPVTYPTVAEECTDPSCARPALSDDVPWCARHRAAMLTGASS